MSQPSEPGRDETLRGASHLSHRQSLHCGGLHYKPGRRHRPFEMACHRLPARPRQPYFVPQLHSSYRPESRQVGLAMYPTPAE